MTQIMSEMNQSTQIEEQDELQKQYMHFKNIDRQIAGMLGNVVSR